MAEWTAAHSAADLAEWTAVYLAADLAVHLAFDSVVELVDERDDWMVVNSDIYLVATRGGQWVAWWVDHWVVLSAATPAADSAANLAANSAARMDSM